MSRRLPIDQVVLHTYVAMQNLAHGRAVNDIAEEIGKSRFATARMVRRARELGLIEVTAKVPDPVDVDLSARLAQRYGLRSALVVATQSTNATEAREAIARITARYILDDIEEDDVVGFAPGRTLVLASRLISQLPSADIVQLTGVGAPRLEDGVEVISNIGRASGGATYPLYAPALLMKDPRAHVLLQHPSIQRTMRRMDHVVKTFLTIGGWPEASLLARQLTELGEREAFENEGVVAEIGTMLLDIDGNTVPGLEGRFVGISEESLRRVPARVGIGGGAGKERALIATLRSGICHVVITDARCARAALAV
ncbi:sugar-binding transcriptional regulator [Auraticoccus cholistanensis]|nr:sugar-binding domain-containing protein [Auraticoccus cholistanensis]